jgi:hypothetical protein
MFSPTNNRLPNTQSVGIDILSNNAQSRRLNHFHSHPFKHLYTARCSVGWHSQPLYRHSHLLTVHRQPLVHMQPLNRHSHPFAVHSQPLRQLAMTFIQRKFGTIVYQSDATIIKTIKRYGSPSLGTVLYRGSSGVPRSLQPGANNNNGRPWQKF